MIKYYSSLNLNWSHFQRFTYFSDQLAEWKSGWAIKHKWERPFRVVPISSFLNCFIRGVRLRLCGWLYFNLLRACAFCRFIFNPSLSDFAFYSITFRLSFQLFLAVNLPGRSVIGIQVGTSLAICTSAVWNIAGFSAFLFPGILHETYVSFLSALNSTF